MVYAFILYFLIAFLLMIRLLLYGVRPTKTLAWLLVIFAFPVGGILFYFILGRNKRKNKFVEIKQTKKISKYLEKADKYNVLTGENKHGIIPDAIEYNKKIATLITKNSNFLLTTGNDIAPLKNGPSTFDAIFRAMKAAIKFIHIQFYIFEEGKLADKIISILKIKVKEGVEVRFMYDDFGSRLLSKKYIKLLRQAGIEVVSFLPMRFGKWLSAINYRNHRKILIVDGLVAFTGGINVSDKYIYGDPDLGMWYDMDVQLKGLIVNNLQAVFAIDWNFASGKDDILSAKYFSDLPAPGKTIAQAIAGGPDSDYSSILQFYFSIISSAKKYVYITNPYLIPGEVLMAALQVAALSGVDVRILLSAKSDSLLVKWSVRAYFEDLLKAGIKLYLFQDGFLHSKVIVSDDELTTIGTANLDNRSFEQNYEVNILVYNKEFALKLKQDFLSDCKKSDLINYDEYLKRSKLDRLKEGAAKIFSPVL